MASSRNGEGWLARSLSWLVYLVGRDTLPRSPPRAARGAGLWLMLVERERLPAADVPEAARPGLLRLLLEREHLPPPSPSASSQARTLAERRPDPSSRGDH